jgi:hypothetical protein
MTASWNTIQKRGNNNISKRPEVRLKMSKARLGKNQDFIYNWKGNKAGYTTKHFWAIRNWGHPKFCEFCGKIGKKGRKGYWNIDYANISGKYIREKYDWKTLCRKCHKNWDITRKR